MLEAETGTEIGPAWREAEALVATSPRDGFLALDRIAGDLLLANGYDIAAASGNEVDMAVIARVDDPEMLMAFIEARAVTEMLSTGRTTGKETIELALEAYRGIYDNLGRT